MLFVKQISCVRGAHSRAILDRFVKRMDAGTEKAIRYTLNASAGQLYKVRLRIFSCE